MQAWRGPVDDGCTLQAIGTGSAAGRTLAADRRPWDRPPGAMWKAGAAWKAGILWRLRKGPGVASRAPGWRCGRPRETRDRSGPVRHPVRWIGPIAAARAIVTGWPPALAVVSGGTADPAPAVLRPVSGR
jgi:hypothetical protein